MLQSFVVEHIALKDRQLGIGTIGFLNLDEFLEKLQTGPPPSFRKIGNHGTCTLYST